jgi:hypothetical protein
VYTIIEYRPVNSPIPAHWYLCDRQDILRRNEM